MIQANELRIGNFVMTNNSKYRTDDVGKVACIVSIDSERSFEEIKGTASVYLIDDKWKDTYGQWLTFYEPIPITEEWLLKFGFKKRESGVCDSFYIGFNPVTHDWLFDLVWLKKMMDYSYEGNPFYKNGHHEVKYIHQLQNLYFALTQTELELK